MSQQQPATADDVTSGRPRFINVLPFDIVTKIFSRLSQDDCLECMAVSRAMYQDVPCYSTSVWRKLWLGNQQLVHHQRLARCLGPHVEQVTLASCRWEDEAHAFLQMLVERDCLDISSIEFADCYIIHVDTLMQLLSPFRRLRRLSFLQHPRPLVPEQLIPHCTNTNITHLTVEVDYDAGSEQVTYPPPPQPSSSSSMTSQSDTSNNNIIYLRWQDYRLKYYLFEDMVMPTLRHCPNLLYLSTSSAIIRRRVALVDILELCPKLRMFETTSWWEGYKDDICSALSSVTGDDDDGDDSSGGGRHPLRYLSLEGSFDDDGNHDDPQSQSAFSKCIEERCQALQYVMLASASTFALRALTQLERLAALHLRLPISWENNATPNDLVHLFTKLASNTKLQVLNLEAAQLTTRPVLNAVAGLKSLQFLNIQPAPDIQESDLITFVSSLTHLEALTLHSVANVSKNLFNAIANLGQLASLTLDDCDRVDVEGTRILVDRKARMKDRKQFVLHTMYSRFSEDDGIEDYAKNTPGILFISS